jgi:hydroxyethylthiazole kinase
MTDFNASQVTDLLSRLREKVPRVHCITNTVAQAFTANVLLALGAVPSMTIAPEEVEAFAAGADSLLINLGTLDDTRREAIPKAVTAAHAAGKPIVVDPVFVNRSPVRCAFARGLLETAPTLLRANSEELAALFPDAVATGIAGRTGITLAVTGEIDRIAGPGRSMALRNGHPLLARVTATGCAGGAVMAAFLAVEENPVVASAAALSVFNIAGEIAAERARGPGSLVPEFLDALYLIDGQQIADRLRIG